jgi:hypothetical protein
MQKYDPTDSGMMPHSEGDWYAVDEVDAEITAKDADLATMNEVAACLSERCNRQDAEITRLRAALEDIRDETYCDSTFDIAIEALEGGK